MKKIMIKESKPFKASIILLSLAHSAIANTAELFKSPPAAYRSVPFWHINGELTTAEIREQLRASKEQSGFGGVAVLPIRDMLPTYLSEAYFDRYRDILETAKALEMSVILYDDIGFPSGSAGGKMKALYPDDVGKRLDMEEVEVEGPRTFTCPMPTNTFMAAVAMHTETKERLNLAHGITNGVLTCDLPAGRWKVMIFTCAPQEKKPGTLVDYMDPEAVKKLFALTFEEYEKRFKPYFGNTIQLTFFDDVGYWSAPRPWTRSYNTHYNTKYGNDPALLYPALFYDIGPETAAARNALYGLRAELLAEGYPKLAAAWAEKQGLKSTGHPPGNYDPCPVDMHFDIYKFYRYTQVPLVDYIFYHGHGRPGFKLISSAANVYDRPLVAAEAYGAFKEPVFDKKMLYRAGMELFARGVNVMIPHGMWYDPKKVTIPPLISHFSEKVGPELPAYNEWVARHCFMLQGGRHVADIAVLYPIAAMQASYAYDPSGKHPKWGASLPPEVDYLRISDMLTCDVRQDFTFLHPDALKEKCMIEGPLLRLNNQENAEAYKVLILSGGKVISWRALQKIKAFYEAGGAVIATTCLPEKSAEFGHDAEVWEMVRELFDAQGARRVNVKGGSSCFIETPSPVGLQQALNQVIPIPDVRIEGDLPIHSGNGALAYLHKVKEGRDIYLFANSSDTSLDIHVRFRGTLKLKVWNPQEGTIAQPEFTSIIENGLPVTRLRLKLEPVKSLFVVGE
jgi:alpha-L-rhamnosidase